MKRFFPLLLLCLLLCGCAREIPEETTAPTAAQAAVAATEPVVKYEAGHPMETQYQGSLRIYPLSIRKVQGMRATESGLLLFSGYGSTTLTLLTGEDLRVTASITLDFELDANDPSLRLHNGSLSFFDPAAQETVVLNDTLKEVSRIAAPEDLMGSPILSADRNTLYYCTASAIRAWNLETGIRRCVKELSYDEQTVTGLHFDDSVLQCRIADGDQERTLFLSTDTGRLVYEGDAGLALTTSGSSYCASVPAGTYDSLVFGTKGGSVEALTPTDIAAEAFLLGQANAVVTVSVPSDGRILLEYYELATGHRRSALTLDSLSQPSAVEVSIDGGIYILLYDPAKDCDTVYRWDVSDESTLLLNDGTNYTGTYYTSEAPDLDGIAQCQAYAAEIGSRYGIEILVWQDALAVQPWNYDLEEEYLVPVIRRELALLDKRLAQFPEDFVTTTASHFTGLKLCLVRQITGTGESGSLKNTPGTQFFDGTDAYAVIAVGDTSEQAFYHVLFHVMETHILNESVAFDQWDSLNPAGFEYDYDYIANAQRDSGVYLEGESSAFIDTFSMSFPKEDRARIMEYACTPNNAERFESPILQKKLTALCEGIREAYRLKKSAETFLWEQYLKTPLTYTK